MSDLSFDQTLERVPLLKIAIVYVMALLVAPLFRFDVVSFLYLKSGLQVVALLTVCCYFLGSRPLGRCYPIFYYIVILLFGVWQYWRNDPRYVKDHFSHFNLDSYVVEVNEEPKVKSDFIRFSAQVTGGYMQGNFIALKGKMMVSLRDTSKNLLQYGDKLWLQGRAKVVDPPYNPMQFDYRGYLKKSDIHHQLFLKSGQYRIVGSALPSYFDIRGMALRIRQHFLMKLYPYFSEEQYFSIAAALLYGFRSDISEDNIRAFTNTGTIHVLSVSGMHVAILFGFLSLIFKRINWRGPASWLPFLLTLLIIWSYAFIAGLDPPIARAAIMISFIVCAEHFRRSRSTFNTLIAAALLILICAPRSIMDVGFQLSFLAVLGMTLLIPIFERVIVVTSPVFRFLRDTFSISIAAQLLTTPLSLYYFGQFPTYFLFANLLVDFPSSLIMYLGFVMTVSPLEWLNHMLGDVLEYLIAVILSCLKYIERLAFSTVRYDIIDIGFLLLSYFAIFLLLYAYQWRDKKYAYLGLFCIVAMLLIDLHDRTTKIDSEQFRVYNTRNELTIAYFRHRRGLVYSTFDSLQHTSLQYACGREISALTAGDQIQFIPLTNDRRKNYLISLPIGKIAVIEQRSDRLPQADLAIVRKNAVKELSILIGQIRPKLIIVDGSNSLRYVQQTKTELDSLGVSYYILKDNFAYVWNKENL